MTFRLPLLVVGLVASAIAVATSPSTTSWQAPGPASAQSPPSKPAMDNSGDLSPDKTSPALHTAGVRGSIDSGGYSAPSAARTQSVLIGDLLRLQLKALRTVYEVKAVHPCRLPPPANPEDASANYQAGAYYLLRADAMKAAPYLENAHRLNPSDVETARLLAIADLQTGRLTNVLDLQVEMLQRVGSAELQDLAGIAAEALGKFDSAAEQFRLAVQFLPGERDSLAWGTALFLAGRADRAAEVFRLGTVQYPRSTDLKIGMGAALFTLGRSSEALKEFLEAAEAEPSSSTPYIFIARIVDISSSDELSLVEEKLNGLVKVAPDNPQANFAYACSLWKAKGASFEEVQSAEVENLLRRAITIDPAFAEGHLKLASFYAEGGQYTRAVPEYRKAIEVDPELVEAHYRLGQAYLQTGQKELAEQELALHQRLRSAQKQGSEDESVKKVLSSIFRENNTPRSDCPDAAR